MSLEAVIAGRDLRLVLKVDRYERPAEHSGADANWLVGEVELEVRAGGSFCARRAVSWTTEELREFRDELDRLLRKGAGTIVFEQLEDEVGVTIAIAGSKGHASGFVQDHISVRVEFREIETDHALLAEGLGQLTAIVSEFPVRGSPSD